ncbi:MAG: hypothetical protein COT17_01970 [Elusimicrobia bacterium CG08_land_8_20_14_0_20_51_18]|nr:MAG: hypothetical protein COT17_01970 [Elusimicrobia bacterium CG08_land_8_20_14_0_20_51_18]
MEENKNFEAPKPENRPVTPAPPPPPPPAEPGKQEPCAEESGKLSDEIWKIKKRQKFLKIMVIMLSVIILTIAGLAFYVYKKLSVFSPMFDAARGMASGQENAFGGNFMPPVNNSAIPAANPSGGDMSGSSLSRIGFDKEMLSAMNNEENAAQASEIMRDYKDNPDIKKFMEEMKNDPDLKDIIGNPNDPSKVGELMKKMQDPKVLDRLSAKLMANPNLIATLMKMANDPKMKKMMSQPGGNARLPGVSMPSPVKKTTGSNQAVPSSGSETPPPGEQAPPDGY